uniref:ANK_REP_REGION domain-containing protein n=1 Tax=Macrostomum lignano TaxID=282301 RepID=A0A1I8GLV2_9PLAT
MTHEVLRHGSALAKSATMLSTSTLAVSAIIVMIGFQLLLAVGVFIFLVLDASVGEFDAGIMDAVGDVFKSVRHPEDAAVEAGAVRQELRSHVLDGNETICTPSARFSSTLSASRRRFSSGNASPWWIRICRTSVLLPLPVPPVERDEADRVVLAAALSRVQPSRRPISWVTTGRSEAERRSSCVPTSTMGQRGELRRMSRTQSSRTLREKLPEAPAPEHRASTRGASTRGASTRGASTRAPAPEAPAPEAPEAPAPEAPAASTTGASTAPELAILETYVIEALLPSRVKQAQRPGPAADVNVNGVRLEHATKPREGSEASAGVLNVGVSKTGDVATWFRPSSCCHPLGQSDLPIDTGDREAHEDLGADWTLWYTSAVQRGRGGVGALTGPKLQQSCRCIFLSDRLLRVDVRLRGRNARFCAYLMQVEETAQRDTVVVLGDLNATGTTIKAETTASFVATNPYGGTLVDSESLRRGASGSASVQISPKPEDADLKELFNRAVQCIADGDNNALERLLPPRTGVSVKNHSKVRKGKGQGERTLADETDPEQGWNLAHMAAVDSTKDPAVVCKTFEILADSFGVEYMTSRTRSGATPVHLAAWKLDSSAMQLMKRLCGEDCFKALDDSKRSVAYYAAHNPNETTFKWMLNNLPKEIFILGNISNTNALHACAEKRSAKKQLGKLDGFLRKGFLGRTAVMYAAKNRNSPDALDWFVKQLTPDCLKERDEKKNSPIHLAAWFQGADCLRSIRNRLGDECFTWRDAEGRTAVHCAAANETRLPEGQESAFLWLLSEEASSLRVTLSSADDEGRNCLHYCAANRYYGEMYFRAAADALGFYTPSAAIEGSIDHEGRNPVFIACLLKNFDFLSADFIKPKRQACMDQKGNTLLHALLKVRQEFWSRDFDVENFFVEFERFQTEGGISLTAENFDKRNCLMASEISDSMLLGILQKMAGQPEKYRPLLINSEGLHAIHLFASKYDLAKLQDSLLKIAGEKMEMSARMPTSGSLKGATCLHLACEAGHSANIRYLTGAGLQLGDETEAGQTCVDLAYNKGRFEALLSVVATGDSNSGTYLADVLRLVDPAKRALQLPERDAAQSLLDSYSVDSALSGRSSEIEVDGQRYTAQLMLLARAFELNSTDMLRSLMVLGYLDKIQDASFCQLIRARLLQSQKSVTTEDWFPDLNPRVLDQPGVTIADVAVLTSRDGLLNDLLMTSQFDMVPACLRVLINIRLMVQQRRGKHEQMRRLMDRVTSTLVNLLDQLYLNADTSMKPLVFRYLTGRFVKTVPYDGISRSEYGPKFAYYKLQMSGADTEQTSPELQHLTVLELINLLDSEALFASECLSKLTKELWKQREPFPWQKQASETGEDVEINSQSGCSTRDRFLSFVISYFVFLAYFAWYVTDFSRTFANAAPDTLMWLFAAALTAHEIADMASSWQPVEKYWLKRIVKMSLSDQTDFYNYCDLLALLFLWVGLGLKAHLFATMSGESYGCQVTLATSFLLWGFRTLRLLAYKKTIGPKVSMLQCLLLDDLMPFLLILAVMIFSFGVFFLVLLYPSFSFINGSPVAGISRPVWPTVREIFSLPGFVAYTMYQKTDLTACSTASIAAGHTANLTCVHPDGREAFNGFMLFVFLLLVNIVMWNLLIALFSLSVSRLASKTVVIWRKTSYDMLQQFRMVSVLPLPLSLLDNALIRPLRALHTCCKKRRCQVHPTPEETESNTDQRIPEDHQEWWQSTECMEGYPEDYRQFLIYQALQLRLCRPTLQQGLEKHQSDYDGLKAHNENILAESNRSLLKDFRREFHRELLTQSRGDGGDRLAAIEKQLSKQRKSQKKLAKQMKELMKGLAEIQRQMSTAKQ